MLATKGLPRAEMTGKPTILRVAMRPGKRRVLPDSADSGLADLIETAKAHVRAMGEPPFRVIKQQFGLVKTRLRGISKTAARSTRLQR